jgi:hypothetical protein
MNNTEVSSFLNGWEHGVMAFGTIVVAQLAEEVLFGGFVLAL